MNENIVRDIENIVVGRERLANEIVRVPGEPKDVFYVRIRDEHGRYRLERRVAEHLPPSVQFHRTDDFLAHLEDVEATVYIDHERVVGIVWVPGDTDTGRTVTHTIPLPLHPVFERVSALRSTKQFTQRELIRWLRAEMNGYVSEDTINVLRSLKLSSSSDGESVIQHGNEAVSRKVLERIEAESGRAVPDSIKVHMPVYDLDEMREHKHSVTILVDCTTRTTDKGTVPVFELTAVHSEVKDALSHALSTIHDRLNVDGAPPIYYGLPNT